MKLLIFNAAVEFMFSVSVAVSGPPCGSAEVTEE